jgi:23S rRNA pseudouridine1911/1915/1917 synthase
VADLPVLYEDNHLLVVNKPAGLATMGVRADDPSVVKLAASYLKQKYNKPGNVFIGVVSRLDSLVSGVLVLARTSKAAARLSEQFRQHATAKHYLAWAETDATAAGFALERWQTLEDWLDKDESRQRMHRVTAETPGALAAKLRFRPLAVQSGQSLLEIELQSGRKHQIRVQLADHLAPLLGDRKYGARRSFPTGIALHSHRLTILHPTRATPLQLSAPPPAYWPRATQDIAARLVGEQDG